VFVLKAIFNPKVQAQAARAYLSFIKDVAIDPNNPKRFTVYSKEKSIQDEEYISNAFAIMPEHFYDPEGLLREVELQDLLDESRANRLAAKEAILQRFADQISDQKYDREKGFIMGSGPYQLEEWITGQQIVLRRKDNWWGDALADRFPALRAYPERLVFKPVIDAVTTLAAIKAEELDVAYNIDPNSFEEVKSTAFVAERYNFHTVPSTAYYYVGVNTVNPKLSDKRVRRALAHIIDVDEIIQEVFNGYGVRMATPVLPDVDYLEKKLQPYAFDIEKARRLLAEAGWEDSNNDGIVDKVIDGKRTELSLQLIISANRETSLNLGLLIQENARRAGIDIQLTPQESSVLLSNLRKRDFELISAGRSLTPTLWNPKQNFHTQAGDNRFGFGDARSDAIIDEILVTLDKPRRDALYKELQGIIHDEAPEIPLFTPTNRLVIHKRFDTPTTVIFPGYVPQLIQLKAPFRREASLN
jgi:peptide/nickel transport system substrate-binding protein